MAVQIIRSMWTEDETTFEGEYYQVRGAVNQPKGVQEPHIPLLIAGAGEKVTLRLVAQYADACNVMDSPERLRHKYAVLRKHCADVGRDYSTIRRTATTVCIIRDRRQCVPTSRRTGPALRGSARTWCRFRCAPRRRR